MSTKMTGIAQDSVNSIDWAEAKFFLGNDLGGDNMQIFFSLQDCYKAEWEYMDVFREDGTKLQTFRLYKDGYTKDF